MTDFGAQSITDFLGHLASPRPTPGGGAVAALTFAQAAALLKMVVRISDKTGDATLEAVAARARNRIAEALQAASADEIAFEKVMAALRAPKTCPAEQSARKVLLEKACWEAALVPAGMLESIAGLAQDASSVEDKVGEHLISDLGIVAKLCEAAGAACRYTVAINLKSIRDAERRAGITAELERQSMAIKAAVSKIDALIEKRLGQG